jgi:hypothetical protein
MALMDHGIALLSDTRYDSMAVLLTPWFSRAFIEGQLNEFVLTPDHQLLEVGG